MHSWVCASSDRFSDMASYLDSSISTEALTSDPAAGLRASDTRKKTRNAEMKPTKGAEKLTH